MFQFCSRSVLYLFQNLFKICSRLTRSWSRLAVSAPTVEVWASLVLYSETRRSKVTSLSYFWAFICLDWKPAGCSVGFCAQASLVAHFLSPTAHMIPLGTRRQIVVNMYVGIQGVKLEKREQHYLFTPYLQIILILITSPGTRPACHVCVRIYLSLEIDNISTNLQILIISSYHLSFTMIALGSSRLPVLTC